MVSQCPSSMVRRAASTIAFGVTCRTKIAKIVPIGNPRCHHGYHLENLFFASSPELKGKLTGRTHRSDLKIKKKLKLFRSEIQAGLLKGKAN